MNRSEIQSLINKAPESWKKMFRRYGLSSKPTVSKLINTVLEHTPSMRSSGQKGEAIHKVPESVKDEAMEGIYLSWEHNYTSDSGIGLVRAMQLAVKDKIPDRSVKRMSSYFARSKKTTPKQYMAWLNWGGDAGKKWSDRIAKKLRNPRDSKDRIIPEKYLTGYTGKKRTERIKELDQRRTEYEKALKKYDDEQYFPQSVLDKLYRPFKTDKGMKTSKSPYTREAHRRGFTGSILQKAKAASKYYGGKIDPDILDAVNDRGMAAWSSGGHRGGQTSHSWGVARVNSFLVGGKAFFTSDADQADLLPVKVRKGIEREALHKPKKKNPKTKVSFIVDPFRPKNKGQKSRWMNYYPFTNISVDVGGKDVWTGTISRRDFDDGGLHEYVVLIFGHGYKSFKPDYTSHYSIPFGKLNAEALKQAKQFVKDFYADKIDKKEFIQLWQHEANRFGTPKRKESRRYNPKRQNRRPIPLPKDDLKRMAQGLMHSLRIRLKRDMREGYSGAINPEPDCYPLVQRRMEIVDVRGKKDVIEVLLCFSTNTQGGQAHGDNISQWQPIGAPYMIGAGYGRIPSDQGHWADAQVAFYFSGWVSYEAMLRAIEEPELRKLVIDQIYSELLHELTHAKDVMPRGEKRQREQKKAWGARRHEMRAVMQQVVDEVLTNLTPAKKKMFQRVNFERVVQSLSPKFKRHTTGKKNKFTLSDKNKADILSAVHQALVESGMEFKRRRLIMNPNDRQGDLVAKIRAVGGRHAEILADHLNRGTVSADHAKAWLIKQSKTSSSTPAPRASHTMSQKEWGESEKHTTYRIGGQKGGGGTFFGNKIVGWAGQRHSRWGRDLPTSGKNVLILRGEKSGLGQVFGDASNAPLAHRVWSNTLGVEISKELRQIAGDSHWSNIDVGDAVAALALKQSGVNVVHIVDPKTKATVSIDLRDHTVSELRNHVSKMVDRRMETRKNPNDRSDPINSWIKKGRAGSEIQALLFDRDYFNGHEARRWIKAHEFIAPKCHATKNYLRYRQEDPSEFKKKGFRTIVLTEGIKAVVGIPKLKNNRSYPVQLVSPSKVELDGFSPTKIRKIKKLILPSLQQIEKLAGKRLKFPSPIYAMSKREIGEGAAIVDKGHPKGAGHGVFYPAYQLIKINPNMEANEILANIIHENLHFVFPLATEIDVDKMVGKLTKKILGYSTLGDSSI